MPFHSHKLPNGLQIHRRVESLGAVRRRWASSFAPARATRRRKCAASRISSSTWCSRAPAGARPSTSTATSTASAPTTTPSPARRTPSSTRPSSRSISRRSWTSSPTSSTRACARRISTWQRSVIINEIGRYEDMPMWVGLRPRQEELFRGTSPRPTAFWARRRALPRMKRDQMDQYFRRPLRLLRTSSSAWRAISTGRRRGAGGEALRRLGVRPTGRRLRARDDRFGQGAGHDARKGGPWSTCVLMSPGPSAQSPLRHAADLLSMVVGDDSGRRAVLGADLIPGWPTAPIGSFSRIDGAGGLLHSCSCEPEQTPGQPGDHHDGASERAAGDSITEDELSQAAPNKLLSRVVRSGERPKAG